MKWFLQKKRVHASQSLNMQFLASKTLFTLEKTERFHTSSVHAIRFQMVPEVIKIVEEGVLREWTFLSWVPGRRIISHNQKISHPILNIEKVSYPTIFQ